MWHYNSPIGLMRIYFNNDSGLFALSINGEIPSEFQSAVAAADNVYTGSTGCDDWDLFCVDMDDDQLCDLPKGIDEWIYT